MPEGTLRSPKGQKSGANCWWVGRRKCEPFCIFFLEESGNILFLCNIFGMAGILFLFEESEEVPRACELSTR